MSFMQWYNSLAKPSWTPDPSFIGTMWSIIYPIMFVTFLIVFIQIGRSKWPKSLAWPFVINIVANLAFTPIQFGLRNLTLASLDILLVWATIVWLVVAVWKHSRVIALAQLPYFSWVSVATVLQLTINWMNF
ncbi:MAG: TspO/MBR family protein [Kangiellaceae bacterium]|jgi:tryptophan-rich sensory protein|nr:TspO/MBR family protein [Kangiellaceae bacterium]